MNEKCTLYLVVPCYNEQEVLTETNRQLGSLTLCLPLDFHNPLHYSPLRLIFLSNFYFFSVLFCTLVV